MSASENPFAGPRDTVDLIFFGIGRILARQGEPRTAHNLTGRHARLVEAGHDSITSPAATPDSRKG